MSSLMGSDDEEFGLGNPLSEDERKARNYKQPDGSNQDKAELRELKMIWLRARGYKLKFYTKSLFPSKVEIVLLPEDGPALYTQITENKTDIDIDTMFNIALKLEKGKVYRKLVADAHCTEIEKVLDMRRLYL